MKSVGFEDILFSLQLLEIKQGDVLFVHSSLSSIGYVDGGADTVIDALLEAVGSQGTLVMSSLSYTHPFDADNTPSIVGVVSETFRRRPGVLRSLHPVHSVTAFGSKAEYITQGHDLCETGCGESTPYMKIAELGGKVMLLGVDMNRCTIMHSFEELVDSRFLLELDIPAPLYPPYLGEGKFTLSKFPPGHRNFLCINSLLLGNDVMVQGKIGSAVTKVIDVQGLLQVALPRLREDPLYFICDNEHCNFCRFARSRYGEFGKIHSDNHCTNQSCEVCKVPQ